MKKKTITKSTWIGILLSFLSPFLIGLMGLVHVIKPGKFTLGDGTVFYAGFSGTISNYFAMWDYSKFPSVVGILGVFIVLVSLILLVVEAVVFLSKKKYKLLLNAFFHFLDIAFLPYLLLLLYGQYRSGTLNETVMYVIFLSLCLDIVGYILLAIPYSELFTVNVPSESGKTEDKAAKEARCFTEDEVKAIVNSCIASLDLVDESKAKAIVDKEIGLHVQDLHSQKEEEDASSDEPIDSLGQDDEQAVPNDDPFANMKKRHRAKFENRIKSADQELRDKYYELRDYIRSYEVKDRLSVPGITFSLHRERYVFITIAGKKLKVYFALNPDDYKDSTIPVIANTSKKFEDLPTELKVKSDLSLKRAKTLVDDVMKAKGIIRPEEKK